MKKKICIITDIPVEKGKGASLEIYYQYINYLKKKYDIFHIIFSNIKRGKNKKSDIIGINQYYLPYRNHFIPNRFSIICEMDNTKEIETILNNFKISTVIAFDIVAASQIYKIKNVRKIVWLGDLRFQTNFYNFIYNFKSDLKVLKHFFFNTYQNFLLKNKYKKYLRKIDKIIVSSESSEKLLNKMGIKSKFLPYPWPKIFPTVKTKKIQIPKYLFFGNLSGLGSKSALLMLFKKIYPLLLKKKGKKNFSINIVGHSPANSYLNKVNLKEYPEINYLGFIKNLNEITSKSISVIFPGDVPIGNRCRLVSCMASKIPIVAHESCSRGNPLLIDAHSAYLSKTPVDFVEKMILSVIDKKLRKKILDNAFRLYSENYSPKIAGKKFERFINEKNSQC